MRNSTLCYIESDGKYLMLHRVKKENDVNRDKWIGIGGGFEENESPEDCIRREMYEETGLRPENLKLRSVITFVIEGGECEQMFLFKCNRFTGNLTECEEGTLEWIRKEDIYALDLWEGDRLFLRKIENDCGFFTMKLVYDSHGTLVSAEENGVKIL
ncbi:MAG: 8-oxo-dGTP diphosphatase [Clostridia bacterium]|nr:8-oxo-dGTP diphosphatase [Clostridia bacterium]